MIVKKRQQNQRRLKHPKATHKRSNGLFQCASLARPRAAHWVFPVCPSAEEESNACGLARRSETSDSESSVGRGVWGGAPNHARALPSQIFLAKQRLSVPFGGDSSQGFECPY